MKTAIYYFSGTGNSLKVARDIASGLESAELIPIAKCIDQESINCSADKIGVIFPVYIWGMPLIVVDFVKKLKTEKDAYIFGVTTCGGMAAGTMKQLDTLLEEKSLKLSAGFVIKMPGNYTPMYGAPADVKQNKMFDKESLKIKEIVEVVNNSGEGPVESDFFLLNMIFSGLIYKAGSKNIPKMDKSFWVDENCNHCGTCAKVCPVNNIEMEEGSPKWQSKCEQCLACLQWCPSEAIQFGKKTPGRKRYHHPEISLADIRVDNC